MCLFLKIEFIFLFFVICIPIYSQYLPSVVITDDNSTSDTILITDCSGNGINLQLTAHYPELFATTAYNVSPINYKPLESFSTGTAIAIFGYDENNEVKWQDVYGDTISLPFTFCFYNQQYTHVIISDNGVISFNLTNKQRESPYKIEPGTLIPSNNLPTNSIFGVFHDMINATDSSSSKIRIIKDGIAPFRRFIVNYDHLIQFGTNSITSSSQVVLYETTNEIDIYVGSKPYHPNWAVIGLNNSTGNEGASPPGRNPGAWQAAAEAWRFTPAGVATPQVRWYNQYGSTVSLSSTYTIPNPTNSWYRVLVTYNTCTPFSLTDTIHIVKDLTSSVINIADTFCTSTVPYSINLTSYESRFFSNTTTFTYHTTLANAQNGINPINTPTDYPLSRTQKIYVRICNTQIAELTINLNIPPIIADNTTRSFCDINNDGVETIDLYTQGLYGLSGFNNSSMSYLFFTNRADAQHNTNKISAPNSYILSNPLDSVFVRVWNSSYNDTLCASLIKINLALLPNISLLTDTVFLCGVSDNETVIVDLDVLANNYIVTDPTATLEFFKEPNCTNLIPSLYNTTIDATIYVKATLGKCEECKPWLILSDKECNGSVDNDTGGTGGDTGGMGGNYFGSTTLNCYAKKDSTYTIDLELLLPNYLPDSLIINNLIDIKGWFRNKECTDTITNPNTYSYNISSSVFFSTIYIKYEIKGMGIVSVRSFDIVASAIASINPDTFMICDTYNDNDERIDLAPYNSIISTYYDNKGEVRFFENMTDCDDFLINNLTSVSITDITLTSSFTTLYVAVVINDSCKYKHAVHFLLVQPLVYSIANSLCDFDSDNSEIINFTDDYLHLADPLLNSIQLANKIQTTYYSTLHSAQQGNTTDQIVADFHNYEIIPGSKIFLRFDIIDECPIIVEFQYTFTPAIKLPVLTKLNICDLNRDNQEFVDLTQAVLSQDATSQLSYYSCWVDHRMPDPACLITNPNSFLLTTTPSIDTLYVHILDKITSCSALMPFEINLLLFHALADSIIEVCDMYNDNIELLDVQTVTNQLLLNNPFLKPNYTYQFYATQADAENDTNILNVIAAMNDSTYWVRISRSDCYTIHHLTTKLIASPILDSPHTYKICNNINLSGIIKEFVNLYDYRDAILGFTWTNQYLVTFHRLEHDAKNGLNALSHTATMSYQINNFPDTIWVRVKDATTCMALTYIVFEELPSLLSEIRDINIEQCSGGAPSVAIDLTFYANNMVLLPNDSSDYIISYHKSLTDAQNLVPMVGNERNPNGTL